MPQIVTCLLTYSIDNWVLGLFKNHQLWKLKAGPVVSHGFRHAEFNGAQKNRFQALIGVANLINLFFENALEVKASKCENHIKSVPKICKMMRGLQIWPQNWNRIRFDPFSGQKSCQNGLNWVFCQFPTVFGKKKVQVLTDLNSEARFGILSSFYIF